MNENLATNMTLKNLEDRFNQFSTIEHIDRLRTWFLPRVEKFILKIDDYETSNENVRHIIRQFDENLSLKANKSYFPIMKAEFAKNYIHLDKWKEV